MLFASLFFLVVILDQVTKYWIVSNFSMYEALPVIPGFFNLTYLTNTGAAFGILAGQETLWRQVFFVGVAAVALVVIGFMYRRLRAGSAWYGAALGLIAGGAVGNLIDRVRLGSVIDFLDVYIGAHHWPAFNVADSAICVGVAVFLVKNIFWPQGEAGDTKPSRTGQKQGDRV